jgi:hypothetical protein
MSGIALMMEVGNVSKSLRNYTAQHPEDSNLQN